MAGDLFPSVSYRVVGSADDPHWSAPVKRIPER